TVSLSPQAIPFDTSTQAIVVENLGLDGVYYARYPGVSAVANEGSLDLGDVKQFYVGPMYFAAKNTTAVLQVETVPTGAQTSSVATVSSGSSNKVPTIW